ncbi:hypothetical protein GCM10022393_39400 [Aquimarina addita]|uniref:Uncharacterized protein n=1 Tax=Aquimarina addita TaxID=870485 RepID=A0ABP6UTL7_9FLAO
MMRFFKLFEYAYLVIAGLFIYEAYADWRIDGSKYILYTCFAAAAIFMFFFKRNFRKRIKANKDSN